MTEDWGVAWAWVAGYSAVSTLVIIFNIVIVFSVLSNRYLHYSYNYVIVMLSLRFEETSGFFSKVFPLQKHPAVRVDPADPHHLQADGEPQPAADVQHRVRQPDQQRAGAAGPEQE